MNEQNTSAWPFADAPDTEGLDIDAIFGGSTTTTDVNPFDVPEPVQPEAPQETVKEPPTPITETKQPEEPTPQQPDPVPAPEPTAEAENPIAAAFGHKLVFWKSRLCFPIRMRKSRSAILALLLKNCGFSNMKILQTWKMGKMYLGALTIAVSTGIFEIRRARSLLM